MDSILETIKALLGVGEGDTSFDTEIITHINTTFLDLQQIGVGPEEGFRINDDLAVWNDFLPDDTLYEAVKTYIHLNVKLLFDPPLSSAVIETINRQIAKYEWRLREHAERAKSNG